MKKVLTLVDFKTPHKPRSYANAVINPHHLFTPQQRLKAARKAGWNVFQFPSERLQGGDLLSDSGTTILTVEQFAAMIEADEAYGNNWGYEQLLSACGTAFGITVNRSRIYLFHQCRRAEDELYSHLKGDNLIVPSNSFFDTTRANAEANGIEALDLPDTSVYDFKGNIDLVKLKKILKERKGSVPFVLMTITNNTGGGQPASMKNLKAAYKLAHAHGVSLLLDACRFAENAWFIQKNEKAYERWSIPKIVHKMFSLCDGFTISFKKDGLANMGGALVIKKNAPLFRKQRSLAEELYDHQILTEGHHTYGGLSGRDIMTIVKGLPYVVTNQYLDGRIAQVYDFGQYLKRLGIPIVEPIGGHAVYIDIDKFFAGTKMRREDFGGIVLCALLLLKGIRLCELGAFAFGKYDPGTGKETLPERNYVRAAVPRNKYERDDLYYVADCIKELYDRRHELPKAVPVYGKEKALRHFKARFELKY